MLELDFFWLAIGLAVFGYFIGDGMKNFKNPSAPNLMDSFDEEDYQLLKEKDLHWFIGISKEDVHRLVEEHPDVPHIKINDQTYYPKEPLKKWLMEINTNEDNKSH